MSHLSYIQEMYDFNLCDTVSMYMHLGICINQVFCVVLLFICAYSSVFYVSLIALYVLRLMHC